MTINISRQTDGDVRSRLQFNNADLGTVGTSLTPAQQAVQPDTVAYPFLAVGIVPVVSKLMSIHGRHDC